jgi:hypothetical protein
VRPGAGVQRFYDDAEAKINMLAGYYPSQAQLQIYFKARYPDPEDGKDNARTAKVRDELFRLFDEGIGHNDPALPAQDTPRTPSCAREGARVLFLLDISS